MRLPVDYRAGSQSIPSDPEPDMSDQRSAFHRTRWVFELKTNMQDCCEQSTRLARSFKLQMERLKAHLEGSVRIFESLSYKRVLDRGFAIIRNPEGLALNSLAGINDKMMVEIEMRNDEKTNARIEHSGNDRSQNKPVIPKKPLLKKINPTDKDQGSLF